MDKPQIKAAMVYKTWIDGARQTLQDAVVRCEFYDAVFDLYFDDQLKIISDPIANAIFVMVRPYIIADKERYNNKCEKNRENALKRANASERKRTQANATNNNNNTNTNTNNNNNNNNLSLSSDEERERERFDIYGILFAHAATDVAAEAQRFSDYYTALGWKNSKGAPIVSKRHAARQWEVRTQRHSNSYYTAWYNAFCRSSFLPVNVWSNIQGIAVHTEGVVSVFISGGEEFARMLETKCPNQLQNFVRECKCRELQWCMNNT